MNSDIKKLLDRADYIKIVWAGGLKRFVFQAFDTPDSLTNDEQLLGGGELEVLVEWLQQVNK